MQKAANKISKNATCYMPLAACRLPLASQRELKLRAML